MTYSYTRPGLLLILMIMCACLSAQTSQTRILLQAGPASPFNTSSDNKLDRSGLAFRLGVDHSTAPTFAGFYWVLGGGITHDRFRQVGSNDLTVAVVPPQPIITLIKRGQKIRLYEASAYFGGGWNYNRFDVRLRGGLRYLLAANFRGFEQVETDGNVTSSNFNIFRGGLDEELNGVDGRYLIGFPDRYAIELGVDLLYELSPRWNAGISLTRVASPVEPVILYGDICTTPDNCPELQARPFRNYLFISRTNLQVSLIYRPGN